MTDQNMTDRAAEIIVAAIAAVAPEADLETVDASEDLWYALDLDSMDQLNVMIAIGQRIAVEIPESEYPHLQTMSELISYLTRVGV